MSIPESNGNERAPELEPHQPFVWESGLTPLHSLQSVYCCLFSVWRLIRSVYEVWLFDIMSSGDSKRMFSRLEVDDYWNILLYLWHNKKKKRCLLCFPTLWYNTIQICRWEIQQQLLILIDEGFCVRKKSCILFIHFSFYTIYASYLSILRLLKSLYM